MVKFTFKKLFHRKKYLINPKFQLTLIGYITLLLVVVIGILWGANTYFFNFFWGIGKNAHLSQNHVYFQFLKDEHILMNRIFLYVSFSVALLMGTFGFFISHKIAGPIYKFCEHIKNYKKTGKFIEVKFRKGDFFHELADAYNTQVYDVKKVSVRSRKNTS